jgi:hypothetical protein
MSDGKVFAYDGNVTAKALADPKTFQDACVDVFTRMIDSVPGDVTLSDVITPIDVKPYPLLQLNSKGKVELSGMIRVHNTGAKDLTKVTKHSVTVSLADASKKIVGTAKATYAGHAQGFDDSFEFYTFKGAYASSFSHFDITVDGKTHDNNGAHYAMEDIALVQKDMSCISAQPDASGNYTLHVVGVTRPDTGSLVANAPHLTAAWSIPQHGNDSAVVPRFGPHAWNMTKMESASFTKGSPYTAWEATASIPGWMLPTKYGVGFNMTAAEFFLDTRELPKCA